MPHKSYKRSCSKNKCEKLHEAKEYKETSPCSDSKYCEHKDKKRDCKDNCKYLDDGQYPYVIYTVSPPR